MTTEHFGRRSSDEILIRLDEKTDNMVKLIENHEARLEKQEERIQSCERQHVRIKTIIAIVTGFLTMIWSAVLYYMRETKNG